MKYILLTLLLFLPIILVSESELRIGEIKFEGNEIISDKELSTSISSSTGSIFNQALLNKDAKHISEYYSNKGLFNIKVHAPQIITHSPARIDVIFQIEELSEIPVTNLHFMGNSYITDSKLSSILPKHDLTLLELAKSLKILTEYYADNGFLFADVKLDSLLSINKQFTAFIKIDENRFCQFTEYKNLQYSPHTIFSQFLLIDAYRKLAVFPLTLFAQTIFPCP